jgi:hypothetical protein
MLGEQRQQRALRLECLRLANKYTKEYNSNAVLKTSARHVLEVADMYWQFVRGPETGVKK